MLPLKMWMLFIAILFSPAVISQPEINNTLIVDSTEKTVQEKYQVIKGKSKENATEKNTINNSLEKNSSSVTISNSAAVSRPVTSPASSSLKIDPVPKAPHQLTNYGASIAEMLLYLLLVVGLIFFLAWLVKKIGYNNVSQTHFMKVTACLPLTAKEKLMVVQIGDEQVVIGVAPGFVGHITSLSSLDTATSIGKNTTHNEKNSPVSNEVSSNDSFSNMLSRIVKGQV